ncbi:MAG: hypothetical protein SGJ24_20215 [Chloroflexota bacterium]|nr:hypothetical protein [Chloroflexota bacterium]
MTTRLRASLLPITIACLIVIGTVGVVLAEIGRIAYTDLAYSIAENALVTATALVLVWTALQRQKDDTATTQPADPLTLSRQTASGPQTPAWLWALVAIGNLAAVSLRLAAPGNSFSTFVLMPLLVFILPGLTLQQALFDDLAPLWAIALVPALSITGQLVIVAWILWIGIPLTPAAIFAAAGVLTLIGVLLPIARRAIDRITARHAERRSSV